MGIPALRGHGPAVGCGRETHKNRDLTLGMSVVLALAYYGAFFLGRSLAGIGALPPELGAWGADLLFLLLGLRALR
ncbi:LptF/LptG family permease [Thermus sp.]|uniref:LptF/LptG family permease n=1 Tax=Thermus sp. TaxID=275 RepID=UPI00331E4D93